MGMCQWFHFEDPPFRRRRRVAASARRASYSHRTELGGRFPPERRGVVRSANGGARGVRSDLTFCFTPEHRGIQPHHTSPPLDIDEYAEFCARMVRRYASARTETCPPRVRQRRRVRSRKASA